MAVLAMSKNVKNIPLYGLIICVLALSGCEKTPPAIATWQHAAVGTYDASVSDDGRFAVISSVNHKAAFWDLERNEKLFQWQHNDSPDSAIIASDISPDGSRAITADDRTFVIWNTNTGKPYGYWQAPARISQVALSDLGRFALLGLRNGTAVHISLETGRRLEFTGHRVEPIASVDLSPNGLWALTGASDGRAILWNTQTGQPKYIFEHESRVTLVRLERQGRFAFSSGTRGNAIVWDLTNGSERTRLQLKPREYITTAAAFSDDATLIATGAPDRDIVLWSTRNGKKLQHFKAEVRDSWKPVGAIVWSVAFDQTNNHLLTTASSGYSQKWAIDPTVNR